MDFFSEHVISPEWLVSDQILAVLTRMAAAFIYSVIAAEVYYRIQKRERVTITNLPYTMILFSVIVCGMMMVVGDSLARAFGLVGVLSMLRFRLNVRNPTDMAAVLFTITIGIACGMNLIYLSGIFTFTVLGIFLLLHSHHHVAYDRKRRLLLRVRNNQKAKQFLQFAQENFVMNYKILSLEDAKGDQTVWKIDLRFDSKEGLTRWQAWLRAERSIIFSEDKYEFNLDLTQWKPGLKSLPPKTTGDENSYPGVITNPKNPPSTTPTPIQ